jgi:glycosyltransferase involved in cell wall biosynthesis
MARIPPQIQTLIIARNEEAVIGRAIRSALPLGPVMVIDGGSMDQTREAARAAGATVLENPWPGFAAQRRFAIAKASAEHLLFLDADEEVTPELVVAIQSLDWAVNGYRIRRRSRFLGRWMRHGAWSRDHVLRLFRRGGAEVPERAVHEEVSVSGEILRIEAPILHYAQDDFHTVGRKFADYIPLAAREIVKRGRPPGIFAIIARAKVSFIRDYFLRLGFLDGWRGFVLAFWGMASVIAKYAEARRLAELADSGEADRLKAR